MDWLPASLPIATGTLRQLPTQVVHRRHRWSFREPLFEARSPARICRPKAGTRAAGIIASSEHTEGYDAGSRDFRPLSVRAPTPRKAVFSLHCSPKPSNRDWREKPGLDFGKNRYFFPLEPKLTHEFCRGGQKDISSASNASAHARKAKVKSWPLISVVDGADGIDGCSSVPVRLRHCCRISARRPDEFRAATVRQLGRRFSVSRLESSVARNDGCP
jgi:hypothetical protein